MQLPPPRSRVPSKDWEIGLSLWIALAATILLRLIRVRKKQTAVTLLIFFLIWAVTAVLWVSIPTMKVLA